MQKYGSNDLISIAVVSLSYSEPIEKQNQLVRNMMSMPSSDMISHIRSKWYLSEKKVVKTSKHQKSSHSAMDTVEIVCSRSLMLSWHSIFLSHSIYSIEYLQLIRLTHGSVASCEASVIVSISNI